MRAEVVVVEAGIDHQVDEARSEQAVPVALGAVMHPSHCTPNLCGLVVVGFRSRVGTGHAQHCLGQPIGELDEFLGTVFR
ncbi:MAG: hypothetical protein V3T12_06830 [Acidiferrobacterales bacterium]